MGTISTDKIGTLEDLYQKTKKKKNLFNAWRKVKSNGIRSPSPYTRSEIEVFESELSSNIDRVYRKLSRNNFKFQPVKPVLILKPGKTKKRPLVLAPVENRIVQRAILETLLAIPKIEKTLKSGHNYGGIDGPGFGVPAAVTRAKQIAKSSQFFIRTDIQSFFVNVPRVRAIDCIASLIDSNDKFIDLLKNAVETVLDETHHLSAPDRALFPIYDIGVAQGSSLSPLICNLYLSEFDRKMNDRNISCIRYIDDLIIFGPSVRATKSAFDSALEMLHGLGLNAYDPRTDSSNGKSEMGNPKNGFNFLGCHISEKFISPSAENKKKIQSKIKEIFGLSLIATNNPSTALIERQTYSDAIYNASNTMRAWGNTFSFCNDKRSFNDLDREISSIFSEFNAQYKKALEKKSISDRRKLLGLALFSDLISLKEK